MNQDSPTAIDLSQTIRSIDPIVCNSCDMKVLEGTEGVQLTKLPVLDENGVFSGLVARRIEEERIHGDIEGDIEVSQAFQAVTNPVLRDGLQSLVGRMTRMADKQEEIFVLFCPDGGYIGVLDVSKVIGLAIATYDRDLRTAESDLIIEKRHTSKLEAEVVSLRNSVTVDCSSNDQRQLELLNELGFEAKTPTANIVSLLDLVSETALSNMQRNIVASVRSNVTALADSIESFRDLSLSEIGRLRVSSERFSVEKEIYRSIHMISELASTKNIFVDNQSNLEVGFVLGDPNRFARVLSSLASSVIERMISGSLVLRFFDENYGDELKVFVQFSTETSCLTGHEVDSIFSPNGSMREESVKESFVIKTCRAVVEEMGGKLNICAYPNAGNVLYELAFTFAACDSPVAEFPVLPVPELADDGHEETNRELNLLVVDDNKLNLNLLSRVLKLKGCNVYEASSGSDGLSILERCHVDGILMDCQMPELSGYETAQLIRSGELCGDCKDICIVAITASDYETAKRLVDQAGMDFLVCKPISGDKLDKLILDIAEHSKRRFQARESCEIA